MKCPVSAHWKCLAKTQRDEILRAALERDKSEWLLANPPPETPATAEGDEELPPPEPKIPEPVKRLRLEPNQITEFICGQCVKGGVCLGCLEVALEPDAAHRVGSEKPAAESSTKDVEGDVAMEDGTKETPKDADDAAPQELLFRCATCKRIAHYAHLPLSEYADPHEEYTPMDRAYYYQERTDWQCADCVSYVYTVEHILAWRPYPLTATEPPLPPGEVPNYKSHLPREYLVKWQERSYRRTSWVPHMWLVATYGTRLKNFLASGSRIPLLPEPIAETAAVLDTAPVFGAGEEEIEDADAASSAGFTSLGPLPDADRHIQPAWKTVDRVLDILLWTPEDRLKRIKAKKASAKGIRKASKRVESDDDAVQDAQDVVDREYNAAFDDGEQPSADLTETVDQWEKRNKRHLRESDIDLVVWGFFKWHGLGYDDGEDLDSETVRIVFLTSYMSATWDSPPRKDTALYKGFETGFKRFVASRLVTVKALTKKEIELFDHGLPTNLFMKKFAFTKESQPKLGQNSELSLMPFQVDGVNWLCNNWWNRQHCILADEMGLVSSSSWYWSPRY